MKKDIKQLFEEFAYECEFVRKIKPATLKSYTRAFKTFSTIIPDISVSQLSKPVIIQFFKTLQERKRVVGKGAIKIGIKKSTAAAYWSKLGVFFDWLVQKGFIHENPFKGMKYPSPNYDDKKFLEKEEIEKILTAIHFNHKNLLLFKRNLVLFHLLLFCGLRKTELLLLQIRDIDFNSKMITIRGEISKSGRTRFIPLHSSIIVHLKDYLFERRAYTTQYLLVSNNGDSNLTDHGLKHLVDKLISKSGVHFHLHQFRHTFAVNFLKSTNNIFKLRELLGHKDIRVTSIYLRCIPPEEMRSDIEGLNIDSFL